MYCLHAFRTYVTESIHTQIDMLSLSSFVLGRKEKGRIATPIIQLWC